MSVNAHEILVYAESLVGNKGLAGNEGFSDEVNCRTVISRAYYSAYLATDKYINNIESNSLKRIKSNSFSFNVSIKNENINVEEIEAKVRQKKRAKRSHRDVIKYLSDIGENKIERDLLSLKEDREIADYKLDQSNNKLDEKIDSALAKACCHRARSIIEELDRLQTDL